MKFAAMKALTAALFVTTSALCAHAQEINLYSSREPGLIKPVTDAFTAETGIKINVIFAQNGLEERIAAEGTNSPADLLLSVDVSRLVQAVDLGITQPINSTVLNSAVPANLRDAANHWFAATVRARVIYASKSRVQETAMTYENLADPKWRGKVCIRDAQNVYNISLISGAIARLGEAKTEEWLKGMKANLAKKPSGGDRDVAKDIASGQCDIGIGNTYYIGLMLNRETDRKPWAEAVKVILPTFKDGGTHVNISGFALAKHAPNRANAVRLGEWLVGEKAQSLYAKQNFENPVRAGVELDATVASFGTLKPESTPIAELAKNRRTASQLVDKVDFNAGPGT